MMGLEPTTFGFEDQCSTIEPHKLLSSELPVKVSFMIVKVELNYVI
jgi:hypothetical protein